jgi:hypothetical protein
MIKGKALADPTSSATAAEGKNGMMARRKGPIFGLVATRDCLEVLTPPDHQTEITETQPTNNKEQEEQSSDDCCETRKKNDCYKVM